MERVIPIRIRDKIATAPKNAVYVCGNSDYTIKFDFDDEWEGFNEKTARFVYNGQFTEMIFSGNVCPVPIISNTYAFEVGVYAGNLSTTTKAYVPATKSVLCGSEVPAEPVSVYVPSSELEKKADKEYVDEVVKGGSGAYVQPDEPMNAPDGSLWVDTDEEPGTNCNVFVQPDEPSNAPEGSIWIDTDEDPAPGPVYVTNEAMEDYVDSAIAAALGEIPVAEEGAY